MGTSIKKPLPKSHQEEAQELMELVSEALKNGKDPSERREFVTRLLIRRRKRGFIVRLVTKMFGVGVKSVDADIAIARDQYVNWYNAQKAKELKAESEATMDEAIGLAFRKGDVNGVVMAQKHKDTVTRVVKNDETPAAKLGVVVLNAKEKDAKSWASKYSKLKQPKK